MVVMSSHPVSGNGIRLDRSHRIEPEEEVIAFTTEDRLVPPAQAQQEISWSQKRIRAAEISSDVLEEEVTPSWTTYRATHLDDLARRVHDLHAGEYDHRWWQRASSDCSERHLDHVLEKLVIVVEECDPPSLSRPQPGIPRRADTSGRLETDDPHPVLVRVELERSGRPIVHNNHLVHLNALRQCAADGTMHELRSILGRYDDTDGFIHVRKDFVFGSINSFKRLRSLVSREASDESRASSWLFPYPMTASTRPVLTANGPARCMTNHL